MDLMNNSLWRVKVGLAEMLKGAAPARVDEGLPLVLA